MTRYIDADKLCEALKSMASTQYPDKQNTILGVVSSIENFPTADVVPKSEVDNWYQLYHSIKEELKQEKMYHRETENLCDRYCIESQHAKRQVAREIFEEIEKLNRKPLPECKPVYIIKASELAELKKKYTEEK